MPHQTIYPSGAPSSPGFRQDSRSASMPLGLSPSQSLFRQRSVFPVPSLVRFIQAPSVGMAGTGGGYATPSAFVAPLKPSPLRQLDQARAAHFSLIRSASAPSTGYPGVTTEPASIRAPSQPQAKLNPTFSHQRSSSTLPTGTPVGHSRLMVRRQSEPALNSLTSRPHGAAGAPSPGTLVDNSVPSSRGHGFPELSGLDPSLLNVIRKNTSLRTREVTQRNERSKAEQIINQELSEAMDALFGKLEKDAKNAHLAPYDSEFNRAHRGYYEADTSDAPLRGRTSTFFDKEISDEQGNLTPFAKRIGLGRLPERVYFERQTDGTCQTHVINNLVGFRLVTPTILRYISAKIAGQEGGWNDVPAIGRHNQAIIYSGIADWYREAFERCLPTAKQKLKGAFEEVMAKLEIKTLTATNNSPEARRAFKNFADQTVNNRAVEAFTITARKKDEPYGHIIALKRCPKNPMQWFHLDSNVDPKVVSAKGYLNALLDDPSMEILGIGCPANALGLTNEGDRHLWEGSPKVKLNAKDLRSPETVNNEQRQWCMAKFSSAKEIDNQLPDLERKRSVETLQDGSIRTTTADIDWIKQRRLLESFDAIHGFVDFYHKQPEETKGALFKVVASVTHDPKEFLKLARFRLFNDTIRTMGEKNAKELKEDKAKREPLKQQIEALVVENRRLANILRSHSTWNDEGQATIDKLNSNALKQSDLIRQFNELNTYKKRIFGENLLIEKFFSEAGVHCSLETLDSTLSQALDSAGNTKKISDADVGR